MQNQFTAKTEAQVQEERLFYLTNKKQPVIIFFNEVVIQFIKPA